MNYAQYLQQGGQAPSIEEQVASLVQAAMQGDQQANDQINQIMQAAQQGDPKAQQLAQLIQQVAQKLQAQGGEQPSAMKCGGKVRAKIKKACGGKKMEKGGEALVKKEAKGGKPCPCTLHKVGGKLVEVDCNGIPVAKNGAVLFAKRGNSAPILSDQWFLDLGKSFVRKMDDTFGQGVAPTYKPLIGSTPAQPTAPTTPQSNHLATAEEIAAQQAASRKGIEAYYQTQEGQAAARKADEAIAEMKAKEAATAAPTTVASANKPYAGLFSRALNSYQSRKNWVAEHKDYLKEKGANINWDDYSGTPEQNFALKRLLGGFDEWNAAKQKAAVPAMSPAENFVKEGYASGRPWQNAELQNMDADQAIHLKTPDYNRWMSLHFNQTQAKPYIIPDNSVRKDIYQSDLTTPPMAQINPIVASPTYKISDQTVTAPVKTPAQGEENTNLEPSVVRGYSGSDKLKAQRFQKTGDLLANDAKLQAILKREFGNNGKDVLGSKRAAALMHIDSNYSGADRLRARKILDSYFTPSQKIGGKLNYKDYLKL